MTVAIKQLCTASNKSLTWWQ